MKRALLITHGPNPPKDYVSQSLGRMGVSREWRCLPKGHQLPSPDPGEFDLVVVYGGPQLLSDLQPEEQYLLDEISWVRQYVKAGGAYLGLCLGAQILAKAFDANVWRHPESAREIGYYSISPTDAGIKQGLPSGLMVYHWHRDGFDLPKNATLLAVGEVFPNQAFSLSERVLAVQFHPEITDQMIADFSDRAPEDADRAPGAKHRTTHKPDYETYQKRVHSWIDSQLELLLAS